MSGGQGLVRWDRTLSPPVPLRHVIFIPQHHMYPVPVIVGKRSIDLRLKDYFFYVAVYISSIFSFFCCFTQDLGFKLATPSVLSASASPTSTIISPSSFSSHSISGQSTPYSPTQGIVTLGYSPILTSKFSPNQRYYVALSVNKWVNSRKIGICSSKAMATACY